jgi:hypothetical protein
MQFAERSIPLDAIIRENPREKSSLCSKSVMSYKYKRGKKWLVIRGSCSSKTSLRDSFAKSRKVKSKLTKLNRKGVPAWGKPGAEGEWR